MPTDVVQVGAMGIRFLVEGADSDGSVAAFEVVIPAHANMPAPHSHDGYEETIYGLAGTSTWTVEGRRGHAPPRLDSRTQAGVLVKATSGPAPG
jgi:quercetin dioxygenase-like cupin family protein